MCVCVCVCVCVWQNLIRWLAVGRIEIENFEISLCNDKIDHFTADPFGKVMFNYISNCTCVTNKRDNDHKEANQIYHDRFGDKETNHTGDTAVVTHTHTHTQHKNTNEQIERIASMSPGAGDENEGFQQGHV